MTPPRSPIPRRLARPWTLALLAAIAGVGLSCGDDGFTAAGPASGVVQVRISQRGLSLFAGDTLALSAVGLDRSLSAISGKAPSWSSSQPAVVSVDGAGMLRARTPGVAVVSAEIDGMSDSATVTVLPPPVDHVALAPAPATLVLGSQKQIVATTYSAKDSVLVGRALSWSSDNEGVATVDAAGLVSGVGLGSAVVTATAEGKSATATVTVVPVPVRQVVVAPSPALVQLGRTLQLTAETRDSVGGQLAGRAVAWSSAASGVADVSSAGLVTGVALGATTLTASSEGVVTTTDVTVAAPSIALASTSASFSARHTGPSPAAQTIAVTNGGPFTLDGLGASVAYAQGQPAGWLAATLDGSVAPATLTVQATTGSLDPGTYTATVVVATTAPGVAARTVDVTFTVSPLPVIGLSSTSASFVAQSGGAAPASQSVSITNTGTGSLTGLTTSVSYAAGEPSGWLSASLGGTAAPATLTLGVSTAVPVGVYTATVTVASSDAAVAPRTVTVTYTAANGAAIGLSATSASFTGQVSQASPAPQTINVTNAGVGTLTNLSASVTYTSAQTGWLAASLGSITAPTTLTLTPTTGALPVGTHTANVVLSSTTPDVPSRTISVTFQVTAAPAISTTPSTLTFSATRGGSPAPQGVTITNGGGNTLNGLSAALVSGGTGWLDGAGALTLGSAAAPTTLTVTPQTSGLAAGTYNATVRISSTAPGVASKDVPVSMTVLQPSILVNGATTTTASGTLTRAIGITQLATVAVSNGGDAGSTLSGLSASESATWISSVTLDNTTAPTTLRINVDPNQTGGTYTATVTVSSSVPGVASRSVTVQMTVQQPQIGVSASTFSEVKRVGVDPTTRSPTISNSGSGTLSGVTVEAISYSGTAFLASPSVGQAVTVGSTLSIDPNAIGSYGDQTATIQLGSTVPGVSDVFITVTVQSRWAFADMFGSGNPLASCTGCHSGFSTYSNIAPSVASGCGGLNYVVAGNSNNSALYRKVLSASLPCGSQMPLGGPYLSAGTIQKLQQWIDGGAYNTIP